MRKCQQYKQYDLNDTIEVITSNNDDFAYQGNQALTGKLLCNLNSTYDNPICVVPRVVHFRLLDSDHDIPVTTDLRT